MAYLQFIMQAGIQQMQLCNMGKGSRWEYQLVQDISATLKPEQADSEYKYAQCP
jgi:hypothetical protein